MWGSREFLKDAAFLLPVGSFLLTVELLCLQLYFGAFSLTIGAFLLTSRSAPGGCLQGGASFQGEKAHFDA